MSGNPSGPYGSAPGQYTPGGSPQSVEGGYPQIQQALQNIVVSLNGLLALFTKITPSLIQGTSKSAISAHPGGGQPSATQLAAQMNEVDTVASDNDSVALQPSAAGMLVFVANNSAHILAVFGSGADTINNGAASLAIPAHHSAAFFCPVAGHWYSIPTSP